MTAGSLAQRSEHDLAASEGLLARMEQAGPAFEEPNVLQSLNELLLLIGNVESETYLLSRVDPEPATRATAEEYMRRAQTLRTRLMQSRRIYDQLKAVAEASLDPLAQRAALLTGRDMRRSGVELGDAQRERVAGLRSELVRLEQAFGRNIRDDVRRIELSKPEELDGLPPDFIAAHPPDPDGTIRVSTDSPEYRPFMNYATSEHTRLALQLEFYRRGTPANQGVLHRLLEVRYELARLLGYASWADYITEDTMVGSAANADSFLQQVQAMAASSVHTEFAAMLESKRRSHPDARSIGRWESDYYQQRVSAERLAFDPRAARPYFEYHSVKQGILDLTSELFGLSFVRVDEPQIWHPSVETFEVTMDGKPAGRISLDMHPRAGKHGNASCTVWRVGLAGRQLPHSVLICNFPDPASTSGPALLDHGDVVVFFHEFGHLVHRLARGAGPWVRLTQPAERDFIEAPSQLLEEWIFDYEVLRRFARHVDTGEMIPMQLVEGLRSARDFGRAIWVQWLLFRAILSLRLHDRNPVDLDTTGLVYELAQTYLPFELPAGIQFEASFEHLRNYSATYYTYLWSLALAKDLLNGFRSGLLDSDAARRYRDLILTPGGAKPATELVADFLGRPSTLDALAGWLAERNTLS